MAEPTAGAQEGATTGPVIRDRRKIDPETGRVREAYAAHSGPAPGATPTGEEAGPEAAAAASGDSGAGAGPAGANGRHAATGPSATAEDTATGRGAGADQLAADLVAARSAAEERLADLRRLQAEYMNYRRRVDRDRDVARDLAVAGVLEALLPVLDDVHLARQHGDLESGPFSAIAEKLEATLGRLGLDRYGEPGETFDPTVHEALMHTEAELAEGTTEPTVVQVLQPGYRVGERVLRAARVAVADPK